MRAFWLFSADVMSYERPAKYPMPTYEYQCEKCRKTFEVFQSMKDEPLKTCRKDLCRMKTWGKGKVRRLLGTGAGLIFKGSGFYITDYRSEGYKQAAKKDSGSGEKKTETPAKSSSSESKTPAKSAGGTPKSPAS